MSVAGYIDHTLLKSTATPEDIDRLCKEAIEYGFKTVCVNSCFVKQAASLLQDHAVGVCSVVGFPLGSMHIDAQVYEAKLAVQHGATEIDMVINVGQLAHAADDIAKVVEAVGSSVTLKVIIECCLLSQSQKLAACRAVVAGGAHFIKTSTGFSSGGATLADVALLREHVPPRVGVKAAGGIRDLHTARLMIEAGASRLGCSSSVAIVRSEAAAPPAK